MFWILLFSLWIMISIQPKKTTFSILRLVTLDFTKIVSTSWYFQAFLNLSKYDNCIFSNSYFLGILNQLTAVSACVYLQVYDGTSKKCDDQERSLHEIIHRYGNSTGTLLMLLLSHFWFYSQQGKILDMFFCSSGN